MVRGGDKATSPWASADRGLIGIENERKEDFKKLLIGASPPGSIPAASI